MNAYLFDTCVISLWYGRNKAIESRVMALPSDDLVYVSCVSIGEIEFGHMNVTATDKRKQADFRQWIKTTFEVPGLPITSATAQSYAFFRRQLCDKFVKNGK